MNEILEYALEGAKWLGVGGGVYLTALLGHSIYEGGLFHEKIRSWNQIRKTINEEAIKLDLNPSNIDIEDRRLTGARKSEDKMYIGFRCEGGITLPEIRHELYHLKTGKENYGIIKYLFVEEPRAQLYSIYGIKL